MPGWTCCDAGNCGINGPRDTRKLLVLRWPISRGVLRNQPTVSCALCNRHPPPADVEKMVLGRIFMTRGAQPFCFMASAAPTTVPGNSGVKMTRPLPICSEMVRRLLLADTTGRARVRLQHRTSPALQFRTLEA